MERKKKEERRTDNIKDKEEVAPSNIPTSTKLALALALALPSFSCGVWWWWRGGCVAAWGVQKEKEETPESHV